MRLLFIFKALPMIAVIALIIIIFSIGYIKAPPDTAYIISGFKRKRILIGKAGIRIPFLERKDELSLRVMSIDVKTGAAVPTNDYMSVTVDGIVKVQVDSSPEGIELASKNFLNQSTEYIVMQVTDVLEGNMREIVGQMKLTDMVQDRKKFGELVQENAKPDLSKLGLDIVSFNIQNFLAGDDIIERLGEDNTSRIRKEAAIAKANANKEIAIAEARAAKEANDAEVLAQREIAEKKNELEIKKSELKQEADIKRANADIAYDLQAEERRKEKEQKVAEANLIKEQKSIEVEKARLDAEKKQQADAMLYERQRLADAEAYEKVKQAEADKERALKEAEGIRAKGEAEAEAIRLKAIAEAEGTDRKAEAMKKYGQAAVMEMYFNALPEIAKNIAEPLKNVDRITMYGEGNNAKLIEDITKSLTQVNEGVSESMGIDLKSILIGALGNKIIDGGLSTNKDIEVVNEEDHTKDSMEK